MDFFFEFLAENIWWNVMVETFGGITVFDIPEALLIKNIGLAYIGCLKQVLTRWPSFASFWLF